MNDNKYLDIVGVTKQYGGGGGINDVNITLKRGEMLVLLGPSGCGKTTLLRTIAGLLDPDSGSILLGDRDITPVPTYKRNISMVFQTWALFPTMTVRDNVGFGLKMRGVSRSERKQKVDDALALVGLSNFAERKPKQLSGGQQQRVALARAIVTRPDLLLLDEPLSSLDHRIRVQLRGQLKRLQRELGLTGVYVTHDHTEALALGDRIAIIDSGRVVESGTPVEVFNRPKRRYTAEFLGLANVIPVTNKGGRLVTEYGEDIGTELRSDTGEPVVAIALRPDAIRLAAEGETGLHPAVGRAVEYLPGGVLHELQLLEGGTTVQVILPSGEGVAVGSQVNISFDYAKAVPLIA
ncbi:ABC transporter ATP-binding protein [Rhizobium rhizogenes]|uniref:ABC transporter ATP-binding protein n=1 Tax=Rhizobium rhizogenes TaxID=359 RepID=UPI00191CA8C7|nr:ABC transporter ATP-binding protein [Rhizobium rhizogenes]